MQAPKTTRLRAATEALILVILVREGAGPLVRDAARTPNRAYPTPKAQT